MRFLRDVSSCSLPNRHGFYGTLGRHRGNGNVGPKLFGPNSFVRRLVAIMKLKGCPRKMICLRPLAGTLGALLLLGVASTARAQAPAGPISGVPDKSGPSARASAKKIDRQNLAGEWQINKAMSDDPRQKLDQGKPRNQSGPRIGVGGGPGMGGGGHRGPGSSEQEERQARALTEDLSFLSISQKGSSVKVVTDSGRTLAQFPTGTSADTSKTSDSDSKNTTTTTTQWQGDSLVSVSQRNGTKITRTLGLSADASQLYLTTDLEGGHFKQPISFRLIYDPARPPEDETE